MSLARLTSISTSTLSLLLERQRLQSLPQYTNQTSSPLHLPQITRNLALLREGILDLEAKEGRTEALTLLRSQYGRMRGMLGDDAGRVSIEPLLDSEPPQPSVPEQSSAERSPSPFNRGHTRSSSVDAVYTPYADDPEVGREPGMMLQEQQRLMNEQDAHLDNLAQSIGRQHHLSLQINDELGVHHGLLEELDTDLDRTQTRLGRARNQLGRFAKGTKANGSAITIAVLILILLILIMYFKT
ncbi:hypothetical protein K488DRAFT_75466 [Vararia minispora EC-137]|uniref:Uncharacterized protein n=1 Tax=Vararia minispora EC-137 TaxID=1314806 RepID=A0ACB8QZ53_9AGAM|nr:hypothetical protein K488DRAFT_75466 [Vararia minispora EC-137]